MMKDEKMSQIREMILSSYDNEYVPFQILLLNFYLNFESKVH